MTKQEQYAAGLTAMGFKEIQSPSRKFRLFHKEGSAAAYFFLGKAGSVRYNIFKKITGAVAATERTKAAIIAKVAP